MSEKEKKNNQIVDEELKKVNGGSGSTLKRGGWILSNECGKYDGVVGNYYYFTKDKGETDRVYYGKLVKTWEKKDGGILFWCTTRTHKFEDVCDYTQYGIGHYGSPMEINGDKYTLWRTGVRV